MRRPGIVVVTHNSADVIGACLDAALRTGADVLVVDNASSDGTVEEVRRHSGVGLIRNPRNAGFAAAVNQGVRALANQALLLLNPDAELQTGLEALLEALAEPGVGAAAGKLAGPDGKAQRGFAVRRFPTPAALAFESLGLNRLWPGNPVNRRYRCLDLDLEQPGEVEQPAGALLMFRREAWEKVGGFDERFQPLWFEDVDFLLRLHRAGYRIRYAPQTWAVHRGAHSVDKLPPERRQTYWYGSLLEYAAKHYSPGGRAMVGLAVLFGAAMRMPAGAALGRKAHSTPGYGRVMRQAVSFLARGLRRQRAPAASSTTSCPMV